MTDVAAVVVPCLAYRLVGTGLCIPALTPFYLGGNGFESLGGASSAIADTIGRRILFLSRGE